MIFIFINNYLINISNRGYIHFLKGTKMRQPIYKYKK